MSTYMEIVMNLSDKEMCALAVVLGFKPSYYKKAFQYEFRYERLSEKYKLTYEEFLKICKKLRKLGLMNESTSERCLIRNAWVANMDVEYALPSQVHMWGINYK